MNLMTEPEVGRTLPPPGGTAAGWDGGDGVTVGALTVEAPAIPPYASVETVGELFRRAPTLATLPVVEEGRPLGAVRRTEFMNLFLSRYGRDLYGRRRIACFMDTEPVIVEQETAVEEVSLRLVAKAEPTLDYDFIVTHDGRYLGIGRVQDLLRTITELQIRNARYANPLTLLPGNVPIHNRLERLLRDGHPFAAGYCDLDNFKPYNDHYGYAMGDRVIQRLAEILRDHAAPGDFVGHIGGDDFVIVLLGDGWRAQCEAILADFDAAVPALYPAEAMAAGGIHGHDRQGRPLFFPLLSLSIGAVLPDPARCPSAHCVAALASEAKHRAKQQAGSALFVDRRRGEVREGPEIAGAAEAMPA